MQKTNSKAKIPYVIMGSRESGEFAMQNATVILVGTMAIAAIGLLYQYATAPKRA